MWLLLACSPDLASDLEHPLREGDEVSGDDVDPSDGSSIGDALIDFDDLEPGTLVGDSYAALGVHILGGGAPGEAFDTNTAERGTACTAAELASWPNVVCAHVNEGFNHAGDPGFAGWLDEEARAVSLRVYNGGLTGDADTDQATLTVFDASGGVLGQHVGRANTSLGQEWVDLVVEAEGIASFQVLTGDFDAVDDLGIWRDSAPDLEEQPAVEDTGEPEPTGEWVCAEEIRNGSEICDDAKFGVPDPYTPLAIQCVTGEGGVGYVSANTGPTMSDGIARCQGWEENGQNAWDHLDYLETIICDQTGKTVEIDLSSRAGQNLWVGVHDLPAGGGHFTHVCIAHWQ